MYLPGVRFKVTPTDHDPIKTGADSGIGRATARLFAAEGAQLTLLDSDAEAVAQFALELGAFDFALDSLLTLSFLGSLSRTIC